MAAPFEPFLYELVAQHQRALREMVTPAGAAPGATARVLCRLVARPSWPAWRRRARARLPVRWHAPATRHPEGDRTPAKPANATG